jgi:hypothetical protein
VVDGKTVFVLLGLSIIIGFGAVQVLDNDSNKNESFEPDKFLTQGIYHANVYEYAFDQSKMNAPINISPTKPPAKVRESFVNDSSAMADIWFFELDKALEADPEPRILPYQVNVNEEFLGVYVSEDSDIRSPEDLDGKTVMMPRILPNLKRTSLMVLEDQHGVEMEVTSRGHNGIREAEAPVRVLESGEADAVVVSGTKRLGSNHSMRPVYYPYRDMEEEFGDVALPTFFLTKEKGNPNKSIEMINALQESSRVAQNNSDHFMEIFEICNEFMVEDGGKQIQRMTPEAEKQLQYMMNLSRESNITERDIDLSEHVVER